MIKHYRTIGLVLAMLLPAFAEEPAPAGTALYKWKAGEPLYNTAVERTKEAMKNGKLAGILWHQGETDTTDPKSVATYANRLAVMIAQLRTDLQADKVPVVLGELIYGFKVNDPLNVELAAAAKKIPLCALVSADGLGNKALHFNSPENPDTADTEWVFCGFPRRDLIEPVWVVSAAGSREREILTAKKAVFLIWLVDGQLPNDHIL